MNLTEEQKQELKEIVSDRGQMFVEDMETAKEDLDILAQSVQDSYDIKKADFKKMCKFYYLNNKEEQKEKVNRIFTIYEEVLG